MDSLMIKTQAVRFNKARGNLLAVAAFTAVNLLLIAFEMDLSFLFSAFVPQVLQVVANEFSVLFGLILGFAAMSVYVVCYLLSKRWRIFILIALILFSIDALLMLGFMFLTGYYGDFIFNVIFHGWILFYLITGTSAWAKLRHVTPDKFKAIQEEVAEVAQTEEINSALQVVTSTPTINDTMGTSNLSQGDDMYVIDDFTKSSIFAYFNPVEKFYLFEDIPHKKLESAKNSYASMISDDETIIYLYDDTVGGSANEGFILTTKRLYSKNFGTNGDAVYISNISEMHVPKFGLVSSHIIVKLATRSDMEIHVTKPKAKAEEIFSMLNKTVEMLKTQTKLA